MSKTSTASSSTPRDWVIVAIEHDLARLRHNLRRLERAYPSRYDTRIRPLGAFGPWEGAVRHRS